MKRFRILALLFLILITAGILAGCGSKGKDVRITDEEIIFKTDHLTYSISLSDVKVTAFIDNRDGKNYLDSEKDQTFTYLIAANGETVLPSGLTYDGGIMSVNYADGFSVDFKVTVRQGFIIFEVQTALTEAYFLLYFAMGNLTIDYETDDFAAFDYIMNFNTYSPFFPANCNALYARCTYEFGSVGARAAVIGSPDGEFRTVMKSVNSDIPLGDMPVSEAGGPFALDAENSDGTYIIVEDISLHQLDEAIELYSSFGIDQIDFHQRITFRQGDFYFNQRKYDGSAAVFKEKVSVPLNEAGFVTGLHTYAMFIDPAATFLYDPEYQKDLDVIQTFTLAENIDDVSTSIRLAEGNGAFSSEFGFFIKNSSYIMIDSEIIKFSTSQDGTLSVKRGEYGTVPAEHAAGASVNHLTNYFFMFAPKVGSELFYRVARETARAYNEGGFGMIYLDALDGLWSAGLCTGDEWYYAAAFVSEILKYCETPPLMEYSTMDTSLWYARSRMGAWEHPGAGYRDYIRVHTLDNQYWIENYLATQLGWYSFFPQQTFDKFDGIQVKTMFFEDVDYLGAKSIGYNSGLSHGGLSSASLCLPVLARNAGIFRNYEILRKSDYFSEEIKEQLRDLNKDFILIADGEDFILHPALYLKKKFLVKDDILKGENIYDAQTSFIRIENYYTAEESTTETLIWDFDESLPITEQELKIDFSPTINFSSTKALKVKVWGDGSGSSICIRFGEKESALSGIIDYVITVDFVGEREFVLIETDNGEYPYIDFPGKQNDIFKTYRNQTDLALIKYMYIYTSGDCSGIKIGDIRAVRHVAKTLVDPTVVVGDQSITFNCEIKSNSYLEYIDGVATIYDVYGYTTPVESVIGSVTIPKGDFTAELITGDGNRARLTIGLYGDRIN